MKHFDSPEAIALRRLIDSKKKYLATITIEYQYQLLQKEILMLENQILPIVFCNTNIIHSEFVKYAVKALDVAITQKMNGLIIYQQLVEPNNEHPRFGVVNSKANLHHDNPNRIEVFIDYYKDVEAQCINLNPFIL
jgi:hypothetical protein